MVEKSTKPWRFDDPRAFQTDPSWYEAYWYRVPAPPHPTLLNRGIAWLVDAFQRLPVLVGELAEVVRTGMARATRVIRGTQS